MKQLKMKARAWRRWPAEADDRPIQSIWESTPWGGSTASVVRTTGDWAIATCHFAGGDSFRLLIGKDGTVPDICGTPARPALSPASLHYSAAGVSTNGDWIEIRMNDGRENEWNANFYNFVSPKMNADGSARTMFPAWIPTGGGTQDWRDTGESAPWAGIPDGWKDKMKDIYNLRRISRFGHGYAVLEAVSSSRDGEMTANKRYNILKDDGTLLFPSFVKELGKLEDGWFPVMLKDGTWTYIGIDGNRMKGASFSCVTKFTDGQATAVDGGRIILLDAAGNVLKKSQDDGYEYVGKFVNGAAAVSKVMMRHSNGQPPTNGYGFVDEDLRPITGTNFLGWSDFAEMGEGNMDCAIVEGWVDSSKGTKIIHDQSEHNVVFKDGSLLYEPKEGQAWFISRPIIRYDDDGNGWIDANARYISYIYEPGSRIGINRIDSLSDKNKIDERLSVCKCICGDGTYVRAFVCNRESDGRPVVAACMKPETDK